MYTKTNIKIIVMLAIDEVVVIKSLTLNLKGGYRS